MNEESIFTDAVEIADQAGRCEFLRHACAGDDELRARIESLIEAHESAGRFMTQPAVEIPFGGPVPSPIASLLAAPMPEQPGDKIGPYRLIEVIGEGGMGVIFRAQQERPVQREVALKIIKPGLETKPILARFHRECQALAVMDHPFIAKVFDAGVTAGGRPYFTMELVHGQAITEFCARAQLGLPERLQLFLQVCDAVQHAHRRGVIHRDIKPSNILVTNAGKPVPKVVDFGVAKALTPELDLTETATRVGQIMGTPQYMSPEQADTRSDSVDTRTDVYSLGVILYELLTGTTPLNAEQLRATPLSQIFRAIREAEPPTPSRRMQSTPTTVSDGRPTAGTLPGVQVSKVRGELDWIVMKSLEKDPQRRYQTPLDLAEDIQRYLAGLPVEAGPPSLVYRVRKLAVRHRAALAISSLLLVVIVAASVISTWQAFVADAARRAAKADAERAHNAEQLAIGRLEETKAQKEAADKARRQAELIKQYVVETFQSPTPERDGTSITVVELLDRNTDRIDRDFPDDPETRAELLDTYGISYGGLGRYAKSAELFVKALAIREQTSGPHALETLRVLTHLARARIYLDDLDEAIADLHRVRSLLAEHHPTSHVDSAFAGRLLAEAFGTAGLVQESEALARQVVNEHYETYGRDSIHTAEAENILGSAAFRQGKNAEAAQLFERTAARFAAEFGEDSARAQGVRMNLAAVYIVTGKARDAVAMLEQLIDANRRTFGPEHPKTLNTLRNLTAGHAQIGQTDRAIDVGKQTVELHQKVYGPDHSSTTAAMMNLGHIYMNAGQNDEAIRWLSECVDRTRQSSGLDHPQVAAALNVLAETHVRRRSFDSAIDAAEESVRIRLAVLGSDHADTLASQFTLARAYNQAGRTPDAAKVSGPLVRHWIDHYGDRDPRTLAARQQYANIQQRSGNYREAAEHLAVILKAKRESGASVAELQPLQNALGLCALGMRTQADTLLDNDRLSEAEPLLLAAEQYLSLLTGRPRTPDGADLRKSVLESLVRLYTRSGRADQRAHWQQRVAEHSNPPSTPAGPNP